MRHLLTLALLVSGPAIADTPAIDRSGTWDVDGPLGPSRMLEFTTDEGTWMNLDVHPDGSEIVFDLLGDLYVVPIEGGTARRLTEGAAYDMQARYSPDGSQILFNSDRGSVKNAWIADYDGESLGEPTAVTEQNGNMINAAVWMPDGEWILARKRITDVSSIGMGELWMYHTDGGSGVQILSEGGEVDAFNATRDGRYLYLGQSGPFSYERNPYTAIWSVVRYDRETGETRPVTGGNGSAVAPVLSPDEQSIAFVRRVGTKTTLWVHNLQDGSERQVWDGLDRDMIEAFGGNYIYPAYDWTPDGESVIVWAGGKINRVAVDGSGTSVIPFEAEVSVRLHDALRAKQDPAPDTVQSKLIRWPVISPDGNTLVFNAMGHLYFMTLPDGKPQRMTTNSEFEFAPTFSPDGNHVAFTTWDDDDGATLRSISMRRGTPGSESVLYRSRTQLVNPAYSGDGSKLLVVAGSGANLRDQILLSELRQDILMLNANGRGGVTEITSTTNRGPTMRVTRPTFSADGERIWFFDSQPIPGQQRGKRTPPKTVLFSIKLDGTDRKEHIKLRYAQDAMVSPDETLVAFTELHNAYVMALPKIGKPVEFNPDGAAVSFTQLSKDGGEWVTWSPDGSHLSWGYGAQVHRARTEDLELGPKATPRDSGDHGVHVDTVMLNDDGSFSVGDDSYDLDGLKALLEPGWQSSAHVRVDVEVSSGATRSAINSLTDWLTDSKVGFKVSDVEAEEDEEAADEDAKPERAEYDIDLQVPAARPDGIVALVGGRIITMNGDEVIENGAVVIDGNRIVAVGPADSVSFPRRARVFDVSGKTLIPGLIDAHAHFSYNALDVNAQRNAAYYANLAYGVTTAHDISAPTQAVFTQSEMVKAGIMVGPRVFSTGFILYGALMQDMARINSYADALSHVQRLKSVGAFSVKSYMQPRRDQRQWLLRAALAEDMLVMPEGAGDFPINMGMIMDGHSGIEHALSVGQIYNDVITLFAESRAGYTATLLVAYGGQSGENWFYQHYNVWENEKLAQFFPDRSIESRARRRQMSAEDDFNHKLVAEHQRQIDDAGGLITLGSHGQLQGLGAHWEMWALTHGGMSPIDAIKAATINGAKYLGMDTDLGSIEVGKLADIAVMDKNPLEAIENSDSVSLT
ncbi:MAG: amidohydrolase family protein, partial [Woeseiaceae bacterium]|nr:amidohydrolase family protein [Woeseiaceae bacterium]